MFSLDGKVAVVTGGGRGIGKGISHALAEAGARVVCTGRAEAPLEATVAAIRAAGGTALAVPQDITAPGAAQTIVARTLEAFGRLDIWVNNAGSADPADVGPLIDIDEGQWDRVVDLNMKATFFAAQAAARAMTDGGSIINITSRSGSHPNPMTGQYGAAKAGVENLTQTMAVEWGHRNIRVNAVAPGVVVTEENAEFMSGPRAQKQIDTVPLGRLGTPEDVAGICVYLAADEAAWVSGTVIQVHGASRIPIGYMAYLHKIAKARSA
ncbi:SDR family NAD(P)-dependent oxidoreductase [Tistrella mobilis]|uniref:SDR family NAD(P)-dependent oxidoreductase n=1 Tax=Tistrella mobilis TaxID=171437 RepID=UPI0005A28B05|nr:glucose 1-dehydrogenase [Tistrella mobilis]MAM75789.1 3-oxoacyl-ACP reductase [Tistrella sp.]